MVYIIKQEGLYQNMVNSSLVSTVTELQNGLSYSYVVYREISHEWHTHLFRWVCNVSYLSHEVKWMNFITDRL